MNICMCLVGEYMHVLGFNSVTKSYQTVTEHFESSTKDSLKQWVQVLAECGQSVMGKFGKSSAEHSTFYPFPHFTRISAFYTLVNEEQKTTYYCTCQMIRLPTLGP